MKKLLALFDSAVAFLFTQVAAPVLGKQGPGPDGRLKPFAGDSKHVRFVGWLQAFPGRYVKDENGWWRRVYRALVTTKNLDEALTHRTSRGHQSPPVRVYRKVWVDKGRKAKRHVIEVAA